jgi:ADP-heptose:LPS heptosyltransferase
MFRRFVKNVVYAPLSPAAFLFTIGVLRWLGILRRPKLQQTTSIRRIFVPHPFSKVGDLILLLPLLEKIREKWPEAIIDVAVGIGVQDLLQGAPGLGHVFLCNSSRFQTRVLGRYQRTLADLRLYRREIMENDYDLAVIPQWGSLYMQQAAYLAYMTGALRRCGYSATVDLGDPGLDNLLTHSTTGGAHEQGAIRNVLLLNRVGLMESPPDVHTLAKKPIPSIVELSRLISAEQSQKWLELTVSNSRRDYAVIAPAASEPLRIYPVERFIEVVRRLNEEFSLTFLAVGGKKDEFLCRLLVEHLPRCTISVAGKTDLRTLASLMAGARLFVGNDSGPAHIAGGLGIPTVLVSSFPSSCTIEHPNSPERSCPCGPFVSVVQPREPLPPCRCACESRAQHCITQIAVEEVVNAARALLLATETPAHATLRGTLLDSAPRLDAESFRR